MTPLGNKQLRSLKAIGSPGTALVVADRHSRSLVKRGLAAKATPGGMVHITASGLRALADAVEAGRINSAPKLSG